MSNVAFYLKENPTAGCLLAAGQDSALAQTSLHLLRRLWPQRKGEEGESGPMLCSPSGAAQRYTGQALGKGNKGDPREGRRTISGGAPDLELRCQTETSTATPGGTVAFYELVIH